MAASRARSGQSSPARSAIASRGSHPSWARSSSSSGSSGRASDSRSTCWSPQETSLRRSHGPPAQKRRRSLYDARAVPRYELIRRFPDGREETSDFDSKDEWYVPGNMLPIDGENWRVVAVTPIEHRTYIAQIVAERAK